ncbi:MAG: AgmX/PglI C-terminal domain-containing protein, partial [Myxococcota bacterium]|nr:AgmX/PglI C-terminal domain-containing protein [Myxococcota bacterium]
MSIEIEADQERYTPRDKVTLTVTTKDASGKEVPAELALAVVDDTVLSFADDKRAQLLAAMYLSPELPSLPEEPNYYFDLREEDGAEAMDLLMGSRGWRGFEKVAVAQSTETVEEPKPQLERPKRQEQNLAGLLNAQEAVGFDALAEADVAAPPYGLGMAGAGRGGGGVQAEGFGIGRFGVVGRGGGGGAVGRDFALGEPDVGGRVPRLKPGKPEVLGSMDKRIIQKVVNQHRQRLRHCYERELLTHPELSGKIVLKWVIQPTGDVSSVQLLETTMNNQSVENCVTQVVMRFRFPETKGGGLVIVTYPFVFETFERPAMPQWEAAPQAVQLPLTKLETVRVFPLPDYSGAFDGVRNDFRETVFWNPRVKTNEQGHAELSFYLSDTVGSFRVSAEGFGASQLGRAEKVLSSTLPFSMSVKLPLQVSSGDMVLMPVSFENERALEVEVQLSADFGPMLRLANAESQRSITLPPRGRESLVFGLEVVGVQGQNPVRLVATASGLSDAFERQLEVAPRGFPASMVRSGRLAESETIAFAVDGALPGTTRAQLRLLPGALANMRASYESMLRQPTGCFEQASSSHFPNVMIMGFLQRQGGLEPELLSSTKALLDDGYRKLSAFETSERAFEWFGGAPAHEALSAYGLLEFVEMHRLGLIDAVLIERTASWLLGRRDGKGGYLRNERALDSFGRASAEVTNAYITYAMVQAGYAAKLERELDAQRRLAEDTRDVYVLGLAANTLLSVDTLRAEGESATARVAALQDADGAFSKADHSITRSQGLNLQLE